MESNHALTVMSRLLDLRANEPYTPRFGALRKLSAVLHTVSGLGFAPSMVGVLGYSFMITLCLTR